MKDTAHTLSLEDILMTSQNKMQELLETLKDETVALENNRIEDFERITLKKIALTEQIEKNEQRRIHFLTTRALNPNEPSQWLFNSKLNSIWTKIKDVSTLAQKQNQINGLVINGNRRRVETQIQILSASTPATELVYSASGENIKQRRSAPLARA